MVACSPNAVEAKFKSVRKSNTMSTDSSQAARFFGSKPDSKGANELFKSNPTEYRRLKEIALGEGLIVRQVWQDPEYRRRFDPVQKSEETLRLLADADLCGDAMKYYGGGQSSGGTDTVSKLAAERPDYYKRVRACAIAKGFIEDRPVQPTPEPKPVSQFVTVSDADCDAAGLPHGYQATASGLETIQRVIKEVAEAKAKADKLAATTAEKMARDAAVDESVAQFGRLLEINREIDAKQRERESEVPTT